MSNSNTVQWLPFNLFEDFHLNTDDLYIFQLSTSEILPNMTLPSERWLVYEENQELAKRRTQQKLNFLASRYFIKQLLSQHLRCELLDLSIVFDVLEQKPCVYLHAKRMPYTLSISHKCDQLLIALSLKPLLVGVDLEVLNKQRDFLNIASSAFAKEELSVIEHASATNYSFYQLWTLKECVVKATGQNLMKVLAMDIKNELAAQALSFCTFIENDYMGTCVYPQHIDFERINWIKC